MIWPCGRDCATTCHDFIRTLPLLRIAKAGLAVVLGAWSPSALACAVMTEDLRYSVARQSVEEVSVIIQFAKRSDLSRIGEVPRDQRRTALTEMLRDHAKETQAEMRAYLERQGARNLETLWLKNALAATASAKTIKSLCGWPGIARIVLDSEVAGPRPGQP